MMNMSLPSFIERRPVWRADFKIFFVSVRYARERHLRRPFLNLYRGPVLSSSHFFTLLFAEKRINKFFSAENPNSGHSTKILYARSYSLKKLSGLFLKGRLFVIQWHDAKIPFDV